MKINPPKPKTGVLNWDYNFSGISPLIPMISDEVGNLMQANNNPKSRWRAMLERKTTEWPQIRIKYFGQQYDGIIGKGKGMQPIRQNGIITIIIGGNNVVKRSQFVHGEGDYILTTDGGILFSQLQWEEMHDAIKEAQYVLSHLAGRK